MLVDFRDDDDGVMEMNGAKEDLGGQEENDGKAEKLRKKKRKTKIKKNRDGRKTAHESPHGDEETREYKDYAEAKGSRCGERKVAGVVKQEEDEENVGGEGTAQDGEWDESMECGKADDAEVMDDVNVVVHAEGVKPEIAEPTPVYAERFNNGKYKDEEEDRDYVEMEMHQRRPGTNIG